MLWVVQLDLRVDRIGNSSGMARTATFDGSMTARRWTALTAMLFLMVQVLLPLSTAPAAWAGNGLFPPTCSAHLDGADDSGKGSQANQWGHCLLCQLPAPAAQEPPVVVVPVVWPSAAMLPYADADDAPLRGAFPPASPPRGPPSRA
jgi:hypothetical protein